MKTEPVPFDKFAKIGIYPKDLMRMPKDLRDSILSGELSPLMRVNVPVGDNSAVPNACQRTRRRQLCGVHSNENSACL